MCNDTKSSATSAAEAIDRFLSVRSRDRSMTGVTALASRQIAKSIFAALAGPLLLAFASVMALPGVAAAQASGSPNGGQAATPAASPMAAPSTMIPTPAETAPAPVARPAHHAHKRRKAPAKPPNWVMQSRVQLVLQADPRFKGVRATATQPGVIVLEGDVFDNEAKSAAQQAVANVEGVKHVINALKTNSLQWLLVQNQINQALLRSGLPLVSVKVIGKTAYISGQVSSDADKDRAVRVVNSTAPDITIGTNLINVTR